MSAYRQTPHAVPSLRDSRDGWWQDSIHDRIPRGARLDDGDRVVCFGQPCCDSESCGSTSDLQDQSFPSATHRQASNFSRTGRTARTTT